jgi:hypothetical protein
MAPSPAPNPHAATSTRIRWENVMIALMAVVAIALGIAGYIATTAPPTATTKTTPTSPTDLAAAVPAPADPNAVDATLTLEDATGLVEEARQLMAEARFDEASDRLQSVPEALFADSGASVLALELESRRSQYEDLRAQFDAAVQARQWEDATQLFAQLERLAAPDDALLQSMAQVEQAQRAAAAPAATPAKPAADATPTPRPAAPTADRTQQPRPASNATRPAGTSGASGSTSPSTSGSGSNPLAPIELSPEAEAALNQALGDPIGELQ